MTPSGESDGTTIAATDRFARLLGEVRRRAGTLGDGEPILVINWRRMTPERGRYACELSGLDGTYIGVGEHPVDAIEGCLQELDQ